MRAEEHLGTLLEEWLNGPRLLRRSFQCHSLRAAILAWRAVAEPTGERAAAAGMPVQTLLREFILLRDGPPAALQAEAAGITDRLLLSEEQWQIGQASAAEALARSASPAAIPEYRSRVGAGTLRLADLLFSEPEPPARYLPSEEDSHGQKSLAGLFSPNAVRARFFSAMCLDRTLYRWRVHPDGAPPPGRETLSKCADALWQRVVRTESGRPPEPLTPGQQKFLEAAAAEPGLEAIRGVLRAVATVLRETGGPLDGALPAARATREAIERYLLLRSGAGGSSLEARRAIWRHPFYVMERRRQEEDARMIAHAPDPFSGLAVACWRSRPEAEALPPPALPRFRPVTIGRATGAKPPPARQP